MADVCKKLKAIHEIIIDPELPTTLLEFKDGVSIDKYATNLVASASLQTSRPLAITCSATKSMADSNDDLSAVRGDDDIEANEGSRRGMGENANSVTSRESSSFRRNQQPEASETTENESQVGRILRHKRLMVHRCLINEQDEPPAGLDVSSLSDCEFIDEASESSESSSIIEDDQESQTSEQSHDSEL